MNGMHPVVCHITAFYGTVYITIISTNKSIQTYQHLFIWKGVATCFDLFKVIIRLIYRNVILVTD
jgi:hypothetical protein